MVLLYINNYYTVNISGNMLRAALEQLLISIELEKIMRCAKKQRKNGGLL